MSVTVCCCYVVSVVIYSILFVFFLMILRPPRSTRTDTLFPYTTLFRSTLTAESGRLVLWLPVAWGFGIVAFFSLAAEPPAWLAPVGVLTAAEIGRAHV